MKLNVKLYNVADETQPLEVQELEGRKIEIFNLNDFPQAKDEFINQGKFFVWSSVDGVNYRVFIEPGYYEVSKPLFTPYVNKIWTDFWDTCEAATRKTTYRVIIPVSAVALIGCIASSFIPSPISTYISIALVIIAFICMVVSNRFTRKKINEANVTSVDLIKKEMGPKKFDEVLEARKNYMDAYYDSLYPEEDDEKDDVVEESAAPVEETSDVEVVEEAPKEENVIEEEINE